MARNVEFKELKELKRKIEKLAKFDIDKLCMDITKELAQRLLRKAVLRTPVDTGFLRESWGTASDFVITKNGNNYEVTILNTSLYADYVEFGHRTKGGGGWVDGYYMLTISEQELKEQAPNIIEKKILNALKGMFD